MKKRTKKIMAWVMLIIMLASVVAGIAVYFIQS